MKLSDYICIFSGVPNNIRAHAGVGILIYEKFEQNIEAILQVNERILAVTLKGDTMMHILSVYAPDVIRPKEDITSFYDDLQNTLDQFPNTDSVYILGYFNACVGN